MKHNKATKKILSRRGFIKTAALGAGAAALAGMDAKDALARGAQHMRRSQEEWEGSGIRH